MGPRGNAAAANDGAAMMASSVESPDRNTDAVLLPPRTDWPLPEAPPQAGEPEPAALSLMLTDEDEAVGGEYWLG